jgi:TrpR-related protein YerC/YecD
MKSKGRMMAKSKFQNPLLDELFESFLEINSRKEWYKVFEDLCTIQEIKDMTLRFEVAKKLNEGLSYQIISEQTGASSTTISRVAKALGYGEGGYQLLLRKKD